MWPFKKAPLKEPFPTLSPILKQCLALPLEIGPETPPAPVTLLGKGRRGQRCSARRRRRGWRGARLLCSCLRLLRAQLAPAQRSSSRSCPRSGRRVCSSGACSPGTSPHPALSSVIALSTGSGTSPTSSSARWPRLLSPFPPIPPQGSLGLSPCLGPLTPFGRENPLGPFVPSPLGAVCPLP